MQEAGFVRPLTSSEKLALLNEVGRLILEEYDIDALFKEAAVLLRRRLDLQFVMVGTFDFDANSVVTRATAGIELSVAKAGRTRDLDTGIIGEVARTGRTVVVKDVSTDSRYFNLIPTTRSEMCVPLLVDGRPIGFLNLESERVGAFEQADVDLLEAVGSYLGQAIRNAALRREVQDSRDFLEAVFGTAGDAILTFGAEGSVRTWNVAAERLLGPAPASVFTGDLMEQTDENGEKKLQSAYARALSGETTRGLEVTFRTETDGTELILDVTVAPVTQRNGKVIGVSCILRDIGFQKRAERMATANILALQLLNEVSVELTSILELEELLGRVAALIRRVIAYEILGIFLYEPGRNIMELKVAVGYSDETIERWRSLPLGVGLLGHAARERKTLVSDEISGDPRAISARTEHGRWTRSEVAVPLVSKDRLLGGLVLESCEPAHFTPGHVRTLETLGSQIAVSLDNARLFRELHVKEQRLEANFALARDLQTSMLPVSMPSAEGLDFAAMYRPAESLGGDYYDFFWLDDDRLGLAIADVSGKGVAAAILMAATRSALRFAARLHSSPSQVLYQVNRRLHRDIKSRGFVSLFYGVLQISSGSLRWSNGGHFPPILIRADGTREDLSKGGTLIALFDKSRFDLGRTQLFPGDTLCFYTDGVIETSSTSGEEYGIENLASAIRSRRRQPAREILKGLTQDLRRFGRGTVAQDDVTAFILKMKEDS